MKKALLLQHLVCFLVFLFTATFTQAQDIQLSEDPILGEILTDAASSTLYYFTKDAEPNSSSCMGGCVTNWPVFHASTPMVGTGLDAADFSEFQRADGVMQSTYKGWPLYYFVNDAAAGDTNGEAVNNVWFVAKPDYGIMLMDDELVGADGNTYDSNYELGTEEVQYFTDAKGRTLYVWVNDNFDQNNFTAEDFSNNGVWPVYEEALQSIPSILDASLFNTIDVHGLSQLTYKGWPMYYFVQDADRGDTKGVSVPMPGIWPVAVQDLDEAAVNTVEAIESLVGIRLFPNPISDVVNVSFDLTTNTRLRISLLNSLGQEIQVLKNDDYLVGDNTIVLTELEYLKGGVYFLKLQNPKGNANIIKLMKQ